MKNGQWEEDAWKFLLVQKGQGQRGTRSAAKSENPLSSLHFRNPLQCRTRLSVLGTSFLESQNAPQSLTRSGIWFRNQISLPHTGDQIQSIDAGARLTGAVSLFGP